MLLALGRSLGWEQAYLGGSERLALGGHDILDHTNIVDLIGTLMAEDADVAASDDVRAVALIANGQQLVFPVRERWLILLVELVNLFLLLFGFLLFLS